MDRETLRASHREASFWNTAPCYSTSRAQLSQRTFTSTASWRDLIMMIVWAGLLHVYALWTITCHKHGKDGKKVHVCLLRAAVGAFGAAVLKLEIEEDVGMQWSCQCSECWCVVLQRWYKPVNSASYAYILLVRVHVCAQTWMRVHFQIQYSLSMYSGRFLCIHLHWPKYKFCSLKRAASLSGLWCCNCNVTVMMTQVMTANTGNVARLLCISVSACFMLFINQTRCEALLEQDLERLIM